MPARASSEVMLTTWATLSVHSPSAADISDARDRLDNQIIGNLGVLRDGVGKLDGLFQRLGRLDQLVRQTKPLAGRGVEGVAGQHHLHHTDHGERIGRVPNCIATAM